MRTQNGLEPVRGASGRRARMFPWLVVAIVLSGAAFIGTHAQIPIKGLPVAPVFEGWQPNPDGSFDLVFGYFNRNWSESIEVPVGASNTIDPGGPDQGQPTYFYPRRSRFLFRIRVPKDFGKQEIIWTLTTHGKTERAYGSLQPDYFIDERVLQANHGQLSGEDNAPPVLNVEGEQGRRAVVGTPVTLASVVTDDGVPKARPMPPPGGTRTAGFPMSATGMRFSWFVYRGAGGKVVFDPPQFSAWEDDRDGRNSPYSWGWATPPVPAGGKWVVRATFSEPGTYVLRGLAHDGGLFTHKDITVTVGR